MRKRHQAIMISSAAKKSICNDISLNNITYELEVKEQLKKFFDANLKKEDLESNAENEKKEIEDSDDEFEITNIKVPKQSGNNNKESARLYVAENAIISGIDRNFINKIPQGSINISSGEYSDENCKKIGSSLSFNDIIKQIIYWKDKTKGKNDINVLELFNLNLDKIKYIREKLNEIKKNAKDNRLDGNDSIMIKFLNQQEETYTIQKMEIDGLINNLEYIETITYGDKWSVVQLKETKK